MTDEYNNSEEENKKGKGSASGSAGGAAGGKSPPPMSAAFFEVMKEKGLSSEQIARIITDWAHYKGAQLADRMKQFIEGISKVTDPIARASAHLVVSFSTLGFALVSQLLSYMTAEMVMEHERNLQMTQNPSTTPRLTRT